MPKKMTATKAKRKAWDAFSLYIRLRDSLKTIGNNRQCACITCGGVRNTLGVGCIQAGHFIPGRGNAVLFEEDQVHGQCYVCNFLKKGNWVEYERVMIARYGKEKVEEMKKMADQTVKYSVQDYLDIEAKYKAKILELGGLPLIDKQSVK